MKIGNLLNLPIPIRKHTSHDARYAFALNRKVKERMNACSAAGINVPERIRQLIEADLPNLEAEASRMKGTTKTHSKE